MSVRAVVHKDFLDARRAKIVWFVGVHYTLLVGLFFLHVRLGNAEGPAGPLTALWNMVFVGAVFVPAIALVAAYLAVAGERESGSIKQLLSTPISRRDVVSGSTSLGRASSPSRSSRGFSSQRACPHSGSGRFEPRRSPTSPR